MGFKVTFREKLPYSRFAPEKEDIESSQKDAKGEGIIFSHLPHMIFVLLVCIPSNRRVSLSILRLETHKNHRQNLKTNPIAPS